MSCQQEELLVYTLGHWKVNCALHHNRLSTAGTFLPVLVRTGDAVIKILQALNAQAIQQISCFYPRAGRESTCLMGAVQTGGLTEQGVLKGILQPWSVTVCLPGAPKVAWESTVFEA